MLAQSQQKTLECFKLDLDKFGFCFVPNVLVGNELKEARERLLEQAEAEEELGFSFRDGGPDQEIKIKEGRIDKESFSESNEANQRLWMLANKGQCFRDMVTHPIDDLVGHLLVKTSFYLPTLQILQTRW